MTQNSNGNRRGFLKWITFAIGAIGGVLVAIPFVGYLLGAIRKRTVEWINLGPVTAFAPDETRLKTFDNPLGTPWDGMAARMGVYVRNLGDDQFLVFAMNCAPWLPRYVVSTIRAIHVPLSWRCLL